MPPSMSARVTGKTNEFSRVLVGLKGRWGEWDVDTAYLHSATQLVNERSGFLRYSHVGTALTDPQQPGRLVAHRR
jgi:iron complex outermembrane receptor protein